VVADADDDTLTLAAGSNVTITTTAASDTITFASTDTNTFRTVTAGGNTLGASETLAFTAGSNVTITETGGAVTIAASGGSARSVAGDTDNAIMTWVTSDNTFAAEANLTFDGNSLLCVTGSASAVPCTIKGAGSQSVDLVQCQDSSGDNLLMIDQKGSIRLGLGGDREVHVEPESGPNKNGKDLFLKGGKSTGNGEGGDVRFYTSPVGSSGSSVNGWAEALKIRHDKILDFKLAAATDSGSDYAYANKVLEIKVAGSQYFLPLYETAGGGG